MRSLFGATIAILFCSVAFAYVSDERCADAYEEHETIAGWIYDLRQAKQDAYDQLDPREPGYWEAVDALQAIEDEIDNAEEKKDSGYRCVRIADSIYSEDPAIGPPWYEQHADVSLEAAWYYFARANALCQSAQDALDNF